MFSPAIEKGGRSRINLTLRSQKKTMKNKAKTNTEAGVSPRPYVSGEMARLFGTNLFKRTILSVMMISGFLWICLSDKVYSFVLIFVLTVFIIKEIIGISKKSERPFHLSSPVVVGFVVSIYSYVVLPTVTRIYPSGMSRYLLKNLSFICFYGYVGAFMFFVASLRRSRLKSQLGLFALVHISTYVLAVVARCAMFNLDKGRFWFVFPVLLVISNDVSAYVVGKSIGKRPLYRLSPKKTLEGFIGAFIFTTITGFVLGHVYVNHGFLGDKHLDQLQRSVTLGVHHFGFRVRVIYMHLIPFILVASFVAPFSGFLASALKRAYKKKDFGETIPGHGGVADRMDCQALVAIFTSIYINTFLYSRDRSVASVFNFICNNFTSEEISALVDMLEARISPEARRR